MGKFIKVLKNKFGSIQACLGHSDPLTGFGGVAIKLGSVCFFV